MIILMILLALILVFCSWMFIKKTTLRWVIGICSLVLLSGSVFLFTDHVLNYTGMTIETKKTTKPIYSAGKTDLSYGILVQQEIGTDSRNYVLVYRNDKQATKPTAHFKPDFDHPAETVKYFSTYNYTNSDQASVTTTVKRYRWDSNVAKLLYGFYGEDGQLVSSKSVVSVPKKTWLVVNQQQQKELKSIAQQMKQQAMEQKKAFQQHTAPQNGSAFQKPQQMEPEQLVTKLRAALKSNEEQ